jgi:four helix bundle protein
MMRETLRSVEDMDVFRLAYELSLQVHRRSLGFPKTEQYGGLADQLRRSSKSICALIAEGSGRQRGSRAEFRRYVIMALGSADETQLWCRYAADLGYVERATCEAWRDGYGRVARMLQALASKLAAPSEH